MCTTFHQQTPNTKVYDMLNSVQKARRKLIIIAHTLYYFRIFSDCNMSAVVVKWQVHLITIHLSIIVIATEVLYCTPKYTIHKWKVRTLHLTADR